MFDSIIYFDYFVYLIYPAFFLVAWIARLLLDYNQKLCTQSNDSFINKLKYIASYLFTIYWFIGVICPIFFTMLMVSFDLYQKLIN